MAKHSELTPVQRREIVLALLRREESGAAERGISEGTPYRWRDEFLAGGETALAKGKNGSDAKEREIKQLKRELAERGQGALPKGWSGEITIANWILKNAGQLA